MAASKQASKHTHTSANAIMLVWGSLRLAPITVNPAKRAKSVFDFTGLYL